ncbi:MAG: SDR family oxidoreductase [Flavobacteriaceae bacterium]|jgi:UDP-glucose 4-epimerase|nr:SDR family oxidoreductase [Flavobacteriaceae bacterium]MBT3919305.1 SDR family oxidoreductase [Flavobacteriaceae bacterium]MBT6705769.1 SDR family oxidoreductase [Flavobacteriaceae bacterium]MBT7242068.1 SDR family oxidoreductase [Flavobacteriaceae bacterium]
MNVLITGGAGYIGTKLVYTLEKESSINSIVVYDNFSRDNYNLFLGRSKLNSKKISLVKGSILDSRKLKIEIDKADVVYHLAAKVTTPFADHNPQEFDQTNNWGTAELTHLIENSKVSKFIYVSSVSVYGASEKDADLLTLPNPKTFYGISKLNAEKHVARLKNHPIKTYTLRLGNVYGYSKSMRFDSVINKFMFEANFRNHIRIYGDGNQMRSFIHIDRLSKLLKDFALSDTLKPAIYNLVEGSYSVNDIAAKLKEVYPDLELTYLTQNIKMRSLKVKPDARISDLITFKETNLKNDLTEFKTYFSF